MKIIGAGCGPGMLTEDAIEALKNSDQIYGSKRAIELCKKYIQPDAEVSEIKDYSALKSLPDESLVISTGDPMLAGLGYLKGEIVPGISSMQYAFAKNHISLTKAVVVNAHGKDHAEAVKKTAEEIERGYIVFIIADPDFDIRLLCKSLAKKDPKFKITLCEDLGYETERIETKDVSCPPQKRSELFVLITGKF